MIPDWLDKLSTPVTNQPINNPENIKNLSDALKVNQTLTTIDLSDNNLDENDLIGLSQLENLKIIT